MTTCATGCGRPTRDTLLLCDGCLGILRTDLGDVGWLDSQLMTALARQVSMTERPGKIDNGGEAPLPIGRGALRARSILRNRLTGWVRDLAERHGDADLPADGLPMMAAWMLARESRIAMHPAADDLFGEIHEAVAYAARIVDLPANRTTFPVGPCPELTCIGEVRVFIPSERSEQQARMECTVCATMWDSTQWSRLGKRILSRKGRVTSRVDSEAAAALFGVTSRTIQNWIKTGKLINYGDERHILIDLAEVERVLDAA